MTRHAQQVLRAGSKSFAFATRLLPRETAERAAVIYAWCRRADDAVDLCPPAEAPAAVARLRDELALIYAGHRDSADPTLGPFAAVVRATGIPATYPEALLDGMAADAAGRRYATLTELYGYGYQVASTVGLMMSHVFGIRDDRALRHAAHLGIAMQLTNICRDVGEDWERGRLYLPDELVPGLGDRLGAPIETLPRAAIAGAVERLLGIADGFYASGDRGIRDLPWRAGLAVRAARAIYARIGRVLARRGFDPLAGRAVVSRWRKAWLALGAGARQLVTGAGGPVRAPGRILELRDAL